MYVDAFARRETAIHTRMDRFHEMLCIVREKKPELIPVQLHRHILFCLALANNPMHRNICNNYMDDLCENNDVLKKVLNLILTHDLGFDSTSMESEIATESEVSAWMDSLS